MRFVATILAVVCIAFVVSCAPSPRAPETPAAGGPSQWTVEWEPAEPSRVAATEDLDSRATMQAHLGAVWPRAKRRFSQYPDAAIGKPLAVWTYNPNRIPQGGSAWLGLTLDERGDYLIPISSDGSTVGALRARAYGGEWRVWPDRFAADGDDFDALIAHFGSDVFEYRIVEGPWGGWILAREGDSVAGIMTRPVPPAYRDGPAPSGVLDGEVLRWWLDHPVGPPPVEE